MNLQDAFDEAIQIISGDDIPVEKRFYGFSLSLKDDLGHMTAQCGIDNDFSTSLSARYEGPPVEWFFRNNPLEMAVLVVSAHKLIQGGKVKNWMGALKLADSGEPIDN